MAVDHQASQRTRRSTFTGWRASQTNHAFRTTEFLTVGYLVSRGLSKAGSREP